MGLPMAPSVLLQLVGPKVANHVRHTLHDAWPDRFPLSATLESLAEGGEPVVVEHAPRTVDELHDARARGARRRVPPHPRGGRRRRGRRHRHVPAPRRRLPVLARRDHEAPRPDGRLRASRRSPARRARRARLRNTHAVRSPNSEVCSDRYRSPVIGRASTLRKERHGTTCCVNARGYDHPDADVGHIREPDCCGPSRRVLVRRAVPAAGRGRRCQALAPGHRAPRRARRRARRDGRRPRRRPRARWKVRYGLMLGLERVLTRGSSRAPPPAPSFAATRSTRSPGCSPSSSPRRSAPAEENGNGNGSRTAPWPRSRSTRRPTTTSTPASSRTKALETELDEDADPGAVRRYRFRHPTASGKTIAAAGFVEAARQLGVLILTHRRLLVSQFKRDLTTEGYGDRFTDAVIAGTRPRVRQPDHDPDLRVVRAARLASSTATRTTSSSATRRTRRSARRRARRSARSTSRSSSA